MTYPSPPDDVEVTRPRVPPQYIPPYEYSPPLYRPGDPPAYSPPVPPTESAHRTARPGWRRVVLGAAFVATAVIAIGAGVVIGASRLPVVRIVPGPSIIETITASAPAMIPSSVAPSPGKPASSFGDGQWLVGPDIRPGTYRTTVPADSYGCYWERERGTSGQFDDVIANDSVNAGRRVIVTIKATDRAFKADGCGVWKRT